MFKKKNKQENPANENAEQKFEKDIKVLWIYTTLFCAFALALIMVSSVIQGKIHSDEEYYQDLYEGEKASSQSTISNIKTENTALKSSLEHYKAENEQIKNELEANKETVAFASEAVENAEYLLTAQREVYNGSYKKARESLKLVDESYLTEDMLEIYKKLQKTLG